MSTTAVAFDFAAKTLQEISPAETRTIAAAGRYVWLDVDLTDEAAARDLLRAVNLCSEEVIEDAISGEPSTRSARTDDYLRLVLCGTRLTADGLALERVDAIITDQVLLTMRHGAVVFLDNVRAGYRSDFERYAQSPSFLVYELWDHLVQNYLATHSVFEERVMQVSRGLIGNVDENIFATTAELSTDLLHLRRVIMPARAILSELATRKSPFVSEPTQVLMGNMAGLVDSVLQDVLVDRDILSSALNNYLSMVGHQTNRVVTRLTFISFVFLPLAFFTGVFGMNFESMPELGWKWAYPAFWSGAIILTAITATVAWRMNRRL
jgi:magnesium transporter